MPLTKATIFRMMASLSRIIFPVSADYYIKRNKEPNEYPSSQERLVYVNSETGNDGACGYFDATSCVPQKQADKDTLATKLDQNLGPHRHNHIFRINELEQSSDTEEYNDCQSHEGSSLLGFNTPWKCSKECVPKAETGIQRLDGFSVLQNAATSTRCVAVNMSSFPEPGMAARNMSKLGPHFCATEDTSPPTVVHRQSLPLAQISDTTRQTRVHEFCGVISRFVPPGRIIYFGVDLDSFRRGCIPSHITDLIICAARSISKVFRRRDLGVGFAYTQKSVLKVFDICYDPTLSHIVLAQAFFPSSPRKDWQLRIGPGLVGEESNDYLRYIENVLAHEFAHILGLRHWDAGFNELELNEPSVLWSGTMDLCRESIMNTGVHPRQVRFSEEDFRVIREIYSASNEDVHAGRRIVDVNPVMP